MIPNTKTHSYPMNLQEACRTVAMEMRAGKLTPGTGCGWQWGLPHCVLAHVGSRVGAQASENAIPLLRAAGLRNEDKSAIISANDSGDWVRVLTLLDDIAGRD